jgi:hypothetical protein
MPTLNYKEMHIGSKSLVLLKNGWPLLFTVIVTLLLLWRLGEGTRIGPVFLDAFKWPGFDTSMIVQPKESQPEHLQLDPGAVAVSSKPSLQAKVIQGIFILTTYLFIALNTLMFLKENRKAIGTHGNKGLLTLAWWITLIGFAVTIIWATKVYRGWDSDWMGDFADELVALVIFTAFGIVDWLNWRTYAKIDTMSAQTDSKFALNQLLLVDIPVVAGLLSSLCLANHVNHRFRDSGQYLAGFCSGAAVMHLAASQAIFFILAVRKDWPKASA